MLIQLPGGQPGQQGSRNAEECSGFEAGLRRDLATPQVVSYDAMLGGWGKRTIEFALTLVTAPVWLPVLVIVAGVSKVRHQAQVFLTHDRVGYGGRAFKCFSLRVTPPTATIEHLHTAEQPGAANDWTEIVDKAETRRAKWRRAFERLPHLFNVLLGDMALIGPSPLSRDALEPLKTARRYYLSARPGAVGVSAVVGGDERDASQYKIYAMSWSFVTDALILWDAVRSLRNRGELWRPSFKRPKTTESVVPETVIDRRRRHSGA